MKGQTGNEKQLRVRQLSGFSFFGKIFQVELKFLWRGIMIASHGKGGQFGGSRRGIRIIY